MRAVSLVALCACTGPSLFSSDAAYIRESLSKGQQTLQLCRDGSVTLLTSNYFTGTYELDGMVANITAHMPGAPDIRLHFDLDTLTLPEQPDPAPWVLDSEYAVDCAEAVLPP